MTETLFSWQNWGRERGRWPVPCSTTAIEVKFHENRHNLFTEFSLLSNPSNLACVTAEGVALLYLSMMKKGITGVTVSQ